MTLLSPALPVVRIHLPTTLGGLLFGLFGKLAFLAQTIRTHFSSRTERGARAAATRPTEVALLGCQNHGVAWTFTHHRTAPLLTVIQNDGRLLTVPTGPLDPSPPPPPPVKWVPKPGPATLRAQALLAARPSPDEVLLARLAQSRGDGPSAPKRKVNTAKVPKRKATAEDASSGKHNKRPKFT
ncbi:hypothetical protein B0H14DRAFT_3490169 [Mycena olivaceomarginata]|nr:hypothetical protein B0H14DRAFT_3490169 [Mycena olivaceomarginata]